MTTLLTLDPGGKGTGETGIVLLEFSDTQPATLIESWAVPNALTGFLAWYDTLHVEADIVVCEHFVNRNIRGADLTPCFIEGAVCAVYRGTILQGASGKNTAVSDTVLKRLGFWFKGDHHHDRNEAARHAIWYLKKQKHIPTLKAGWPQ